MAVMRLVAAVALVSAAACGIPSEGPAMRPGEDCSTCHGAGEAPNFTASGTLYTNPTDAASQGVKGGRVHVTDASGKTLSLKTNETGNFYTREPLAYPLQVAVEKDGRFSVMSVPAPDGACGRCHTAATLPPPSTQFQDGAKAAPGRVALVGGLGDEFMLPGFDCQSCHRAGGQAPSAQFTASGTVFASGGGGDPGVTVTITDAQGRVFTAITNRVGNFFMTQPIAFGRSARVRITKGAASRLMEEELPHGSCNACHRRGGEQSPVSLSGGDGGGD